MYRNRYVPKWTCTDMYMYRNGHFYVPKLLATMSRSRHRHDVGVLQTTSTGPKMTCTLCPKMDTYYQSGLNPMSPMKLKMNLSLFQ